MTLDFVIKIILVSLGYLLGVSIMFLGMRSRIKELEEENKMLRIIVVRDLLKTLGLDKLFNKRPAKRSKKK